MAVFLPQTPMNSTSAARLSVMSLVDETHSGVRGRSGQPALPENAGSDACGGCGTGARNRRTATKTVGCRVSGGPGSYAVTACLSSLLVTWMLRGLAASRTGMVRVRTPAE